MRSKLLIAAFVVFVAAASAVLAFDSNAPRTLRVRMLAPDGKPIPKESIREFHIRNLTDELVYAKIELSDGVAVIPMPDQPFQISTVLKVPGFGEVAVYADNHGKGYSTPGQIDFLTDAAATRLERVRAALGKAKSEGLVMPKSFAEKLAAAAKDTPYGSLAVTLAAGEELTLARANYRISKYKAPRKSFLFGCNCSPPEAHTPNFDTAWKSLFNWGTANLYMSGYAKEEGKRDFTRADWEVDWMWNNGVRDIKPCPPIYMANGVTPPWLKTKQWPELRTILRDMVYDVCKHYADKAQFCEIVNEAHDKSNSLALTPEQLNECAVIASKAAREGNPKVKRIINSCRIWGEYAIKPNKAGRIPRSPYKYMQDSIKAGCEFEIVGLQLYYPDRDLFEIERTLDRYARFGKPILITEMECSSQPGISPTCTHPKESPPWHEVWSEKTQADWVEGMYTIAYSKSYIQGIGWWSLQDGREFWPWGGLLRHDGTPKPSYHRIKALQEKWGFEFGKGL